MTIQQANTHIDTVAYGLYNGDVNIDFTIAEQCEDSQDPLDFNTFAVDRGCGRGLPISFHLIAVLNEFGQQNGFNEFLKRIKNIENPIPINNLFLIIDSLSLSFQSLTKQFCQIFVPKLEQLTLKWLQNIEIDFKNDKQMEQIDGIWMRVDRFLGRTHTLKEQELFRDRFEQIVRNKKNKNIESLNDENVLVLLTDELYSIEAKIDLLCQGFIRFHSEDCFTSYEIPTDVRQLIIQFAMTNYLELLVI